MQRHGEYKMPGGKLVVADLDIEDGHLAQVGISGDFFLEPDSALAVIDRALTGLAADSHVATFIQALEAALPADTLMYGVDAEAIAIAVRRAIDNGDPR